MKKKSVLAAFLIATFCLSACSGKDQEPSFAGWGSSTATTSTEGEDLTIGLGGFADGNSSNQIETPMSVEDIDANTLSGTLYSYQNVVDPQTGMIVAVVPVPYGWKLEYSVNWEQYSARTPGLVTITVTSPDNSVSIQRMTMQSYEYEESYDTMFGTSSSSSGYDTETYHIDREPILANMVAEEIMTQVYGVSDYTLVDQKNLDDSPEGQAIQSYLDIRVTAQYAAAQVLSDRATLTVDGADYNTCANIYNTPNFICEIDTAACYVYTTLVGYASPNFVTNYTSWDIPFVHVFIANNEELYNEYYSVYQFINENIVMSDEYYQYSKALSAYINENVAEYINNKLQNQNNVYSGTWETDYPESGDTYSFTDAFSDYIYDQNDYEMPDGTHFQVGTEVDCVATDGTYVYTGDYGGLPTGWEVLTPTEIGN